MRDTDILMPALSPAMDTGKLARWLVDAGDTVRAGDIIAEIETAQATMEVEAVNDGVIARILVPEGSEGVRVNTPIATVRLGDIGGLVSPAPHERDAMRESSLAPAGSFAVAAATDEAGNDVEDVVASVDADWASSSTGVAAHARASVTQTLREALRDAMAEEMRRDGDVFLIGEEVGLNQGACKVSQGLLDEFGPRRVVDTPITEQGFAGIGVGAAFAGLKPVVEFMTWNFAMQAIDHIINSAAKTHYMSGGEINVPIVFRGGNGAAAQVGAQHAQCYSAWYAHVPGLKVVAPATPADAKGLLKAAIRDPNPVLMLENEALYEATGAVPTDADHLVEIGKARIARSGGDVTVVTFARGVVYAMAAAERLAGEGIDVEVIDLRTLRPLDLATVTRSVAKTHRLVTVEEAWPVCSIGSEICARVAIEAFDELDAPPVKVSGADVPMPYAANLEALALPNDEAVAWAIRKVCHASL